MRALTTLSPPASPSPRPAWRAARTVARIAAAGVGAAIAGYAVVAASTWLGYGRPRPPAARDVDPLLDRFMPAYEIVERHSVSVAAPAEITLAAARDQDLLAVPAIRAIFNARAFALGSRPDDRTRPQALVAQMLSLGWGVLAEEPGREIVMGAATKPWEANPRFRPIAPDAFAAFAEADHVKIIWSLRADPIGADASVFRTETRAVATDAAARMKFRRYWSLVAPGVALIRTLSLGPLKAHAERRAVELEAAQHPAATR